MAHSYRRPSSPLLFASVQLALLGPLEVTSGRGRVVLSAPKERAVLGMLALRAGRPVQAELLYEGLWGQNAPPSAAKALHTYVAHLRRALSPGYIVTVSGAYLLQIGPGAVDAARFEQAVHEARQLSEAGDHGSAASVLQEGLGLWRGRPYPELTEHSWATAETARLEELRREAEEELAELHLALGEGTRLVGELEARVAAEPLRERRWAQLMLAYYRAGRQADALRAFAGCGRPWPRNWGSAPRPISWPWNKRCSCSPPSSKSASSLRKPPVPPHHLELPRSTGQPAASSAGPAK